MLQVTGRAFLGGTYAGGVATAPVRGLKRLDLPNCPRLDPSAVEWIAAGCTGLRSLVVSGCISAKPEGVELLAANHPDLLRLGISGYEGLGRSTALAFVAERSGSHLRYLDVSDNPATAAVDVGKILRNCGRLESVDLSGLTKVDRFSFRGLGGGRAHTWAHGRTAAHAQADRSCLMSSDGSGVSGGEKDGTSNRARGNPALPHLRVVRMLRVPRLDDACLVLLAGACPSLEELMMSDSPKVTGACLTPVATLCPLLRSLGLDRCGAASDEASLADTCRRLPCLEHLSLGVALEDNADYGRTLTGSGRSGNGRGGSSRGSGGHQHISRAPSRRAPYGGVLDVSSSCSSSVTGDSSRNQDSGNPPFTGEILLAAASSACTRLRTLGLEGHKHMSFLSRQCPPGAFPCLTELKLTGCAGVDDAGLIVVLEACPRVRSLSLAGSGVSQDGLARSVSALHLCFVEILPPMIVNLPVTAGGSRLTISAPTTSALLGRKPPEQHHTEGAAQNSSIQTKLLGTADTISTGTTAATEFKLGSSSNSSRGGNRSVVFSEHAMATGLRPAGHHNLHLAAAAVISRFDEEQRALETVGRALRHFRDRRAGILMSSARAICRGMLAYRFRTNDGHPDKVSHSRAYAENQLARLA